MKLTYPNLLALCSCMLLTFVTFAEGQPLTTFQFIPGDNGVFAAAYRDTQFAVEPSTDSGSRSIHVQDTGTDISWSSSPWFLSTDTQATWDITDSSLFFSGGISMTKDNAPPILNNTPLSYIQFSGTLHTNQPVKLTLTYQTTTPNSANFVVSHSDNSLAVYSTNSNSTAEIFLDGNHDYHIYGTFTFTLVGQDGTISTDFSSRIDITPTAVPEPSEWAALLSGFCALGIAGREWRKRRRVVA